MPGVFSTTQRKILPASLFGAAIVLSSPWIGEARSWLRRALPTEFNLVINASLGAVALAAVAVSVWRIREDRARRYAALIGAAALATITAVWTAAPSASQNAVERVHFVEYGLMTALFYRAWRERSDLSIVLLPLFAGLIVGTADEWWQWFVPERIGEWRDIFINFGAIGSGLLVSLALAPPAAFDIGLRPDSRRAVCLAAAASVLALALFIQTVHLGHVVTDHEIGVFRSRYTADELLALAADRGVRWRVDPPPMTIHRLSREDQYLAEALWHVRARNDAWGVGDIGRAWRENLTLERYFAPALDLRSYLTPDGVRWPDPQRADAEARARPARDEEFTSLAAPANFVLVWPRADFWAGTLGPFCAVRCGRIVAAAPWTRYSPRYLTCCYTSAVRGDSRQDLYAKALALLGLGVLAGAGALVDYWPADLNVPRTASALIRPARLHALAIPQALPVLPVASAPGSVRGTLQRAGIVTTGVPAAILDAAADARVSLAPPPPSTFDVPAVPVAAVPARPVELSAPPTPEFDDESNDVIEPPVRQFASSQNADDSFFLTDAFKTAGGSIANAGGTIVTAGVKTGQSLAGALRVAAGAVRKLKFFQISSVPASRPSA